jgi:hypothetical protein
MRLILLNMCSRLHQETRLRLKNTPLPSILHKTARGSPSLPHEHATVNV